MLLLHVCDIAFKPNNQYIKSYISFSIELSAAQALAWNHILYIFKELYSNQNRKGEATFAVNISKQLL